MLVDESDCDDDDDNVDEKEEVEVDDIVPLLEELCDTELAPLFKS